MSDVKSKIEAANQKVLEIFCAAKPELVDVQPAIDVIPGMKPNLIMHSAPEIKFDDMCGPHKRGIVGAAIWEGLAKTEEEAVAKLQSGEIELSPCHHHDSVGAGTGIMTASFPAMIVENKEHGTRAYTNLSEGGGLNILKWGAYDENVSKMLTWHAKVLGPVLSKVLKASGPIDIKNIISRAVQMGDECHNRTVASTSLFLKELYPHFMDVDAPEQDVRDVIKYLVEAEHFMLHGIMAGAKATVLAAEGVEYSTVVTAMARNGVDFGIKVSGLGDQWFTAPASQIRGLFFRAEWGYDDAAPDLGDSCITETVGLGGFIQPSAPTVTQYVQADLAKAISNTQEMTEICVGTNNDVRIPAMDFAPAPICIDIRKVVQTGITPLIDTGIPHKNGGLIGAGEVNAPVGCFEKALKAFAEKVAG